MKKELTNISEKSLMELEDIVNEEMLTTEDVFFLFEQSRQLEIVYPYFKMIRY